MNPPDSSARLLQNKISAPFQASPRQGDNTQVQAGFQASLTDSGSLNTSTTKAESQASLSSKGQIAKVKVTKGKGQKSKRFKADGLTFRVRLSDRGYRVMLLLVEGGRERELYLASLRSAELAEIEHDSAAFLAKVKEKLRARIVKADDSEAAKLKTLLTTIEEKNK